MQVDRNSGFISYIENVSRNYFMGFGDKSGRAWRIALACTVIFPLLMALVWGVSATFLLAGQVKIFPHHERSVVMHAIDNLGQQTLLNNSEPSPSPHLIGPSLPKIGWPDNLPDFSQVSSNQLVPLKVTGVDPTRAPTRVDFLRDKGYEIDPPIIATAPWVPRKLIEHLMQHKRQNAYATKWLGGNQAFSETTWILDCITNMEGALHTFFAPLIKANLTYDFVYMGKGSKVNSLGGLGRPVIMSAAIQPDMESNYPGSTVIFRICQLKGEEVPGKPLQDDFEVLSAAAKQDNGKRTAYDETLRQHMIYHLTSGHKLPSIGQIKIVDQFEGLAQLEQLISSGSASSKELEGIAIQIGHRVLSLEVLYNLYKIQLENELLSLERLCPQGYVYSIDPPHIFLEAIGGSMNGAFLNRLQALAMKELAAKGLLKNMKKVCFAHFSDIEGAQYYEKALVTAGISVLKKHHVPNGGGGPFAYDPFKDPMYLIDEQWVLVIHNNSDAFGQNIQFEGLSSLDGYLGTYSDAARALLRNRKDLCSHIVDPRS